MRVHTEGDLGCGGQGGEKSRNVSLRKGQLSRDLSQEGRGGEESPKQTGSPESLPDADVGSSF